MLRDMSGLDPALDAWKRKRDAFRWETPDPFNFGADVIGRCARPCWGAAPTAPSGACATPTSPRRRTASRTCSGASASVPATRSW
jgi:hypothetical protein